MSFTENIAQGKIEFFNHDDKSYVVSARNDLVALKDLDSKDFEKKYTVILNALNCILDESKPVDRKIITGSINQLQNDALAAAMPPTKPKFKFIENCVESLSTVLHKTNLHTSPGVSNAIAED